MEWRSGGSAAAMGGCIRWQKGITSSSRSLSMAEEREAAVVAAMEAAFAAVAERSHLQRRLRGRGGFAMKYSNRGVVTGQCRNTTCCSQRRNRFWLRWSCLNIQDDGSTCRKGSHGEPSHPSPGQVAVAGWKLQPEIQWRRDHRL